MKTLSFKFIAFSLTIFLMFSYLLYIFGISSFILPHIAIITTLFFSEKKVNKRLFIIILVTFLYSQAGAPVSLFFIILISCQIYIITSIFFSFTAFDFSLTALINCLLIVFIINLNRFLYVFVFTGELRIFQLLAYSTVSSLILIIIYVFYKPYIDRFFVKDSWL
ncbi:MAG TPA: hypothetical protein PKG52_06915 [bacterium]|nr:hypothetical protein [bacterium]HPS29253.1 hypothetical protein [bacterium]